jgi:putative hydrolase of the HAD superfamily
VTYLLGLVVNAVGKKLFRAQDRWIRSLELQGYAGSLKFRSLIRNLDLGVSDFECVDPMEETGWLRSRLLALAGWDLGRTAKHNARILENRYRVVGQLPFAAMTASSAAHSDISFQRATVRVSRNSSMILGVAALWALTRALSIPDARFLIAFAVLSGLSLGAYFSFLQRARWYALDSIKYSLANLTQGEPKKISGLIFDLGGVLTRDIRERLFEKLAYDDPPLRRIAASVSDTIWEEAAIRPMEIQAFWVRLREEVSKSYSAFPKRLLSDEALDKLSEELLECNVTVLNLVKEARSLSLPIALCTNNTSFWMERLDQRFQLRQLFDAVAISCDEGTAKPAPELIEVAARGLGVALDSLVFIDDREENCRAAARLGLQPVLFRTAKALRSTLRGFGLPLRPDSCKDEWLRELSGSSPSEKSKS